MERDSFDRLVRFFGTAGTRRAALRLFATGLVLGGAATLEGTDAKGRRNRKASRDQRVRVEQTDACSPVPFVCTSANTGNRNGCSREAEPERCYGKRFGPGANLKNCNYLNQGFFDVDLDGANLTGTCWLASELFNRPSLRGANVSKACFFETDLSFSDFRGTNVRGASFCFADLTGVDFRGSNITAKQLATAAVVACDTILPNGKPAVQCPAGQICCTGACCAPENCVDGTCTGG